MTKKTLVFSASFLIAAGVAAGFALPSRAEENGTAVASKPVVKRLSALEVLVVRPQTHRESLRIEGFLMPARKVVLSAKLSGVVTDVTADVGDPVRKGDVLVRFNEDQAQLQLAGRAARAQGKEAELDRARRELERGRGLAEGGTVALSKLASLETDVRMLEAERDALRAEEGEARRQLKEAQLSAPFDGTVSQRKISPGQSVSENTELIEIVDPSTMTLTAAVPLEATPRLSVGQTAEIRIEGLDARMLSARLDRIAPVALDTSRSLQIFLTVDDREGMLRGGMFAQGALHLRSDQNIIAIPTPALQEKNGESAVLLVSDGRLVEQPVTRGRLLDDGKLTEIRKGLKSGDTILALPLPGMGAGAAVEIVGHDGVKP